jgi:hypothetical protein
VNYFRSVKKYLFGVVCVDYWCELRGEDKYKHSVNIKLFGKAVFILVVQSKTTGFVMIDNEEPT